MPRLNAVDPAKAEGLARELLEAVHKKLGMTPNMMRTMAQSPAALSGYLGLSGALGDGRLSAKLRERIAIAIARRNGCHYCLAAHATIGKMVGLTDQEMVAAAGADADDAKDHAALELALAVMEHRGAVSDSELVRARTAGLDDGEITEVVAHVALNVLTNYLNTVSQTEIDFPAVDARLRV